MKVFNSMIILFIIGFLSFGPVTAQSEIEKTGDSLLVDEDIRYGRLPNGLTFYVKPLSQPQDKLHLTFYVKAGINQEEEDQMDMAHAVEHLAFGASTSFPQGISNNIELVNKLKMIDWGISGTTSFSATRYFFDVSPHHPEAISFGLQWFKDIATGLKLRDADIEKERGVLRQEFIYSNSGDLSAEYKLKSQLFPCRKDYSNFLSNNQTFTRGSLKRFYEQWYHPDLMAVVIVGNMEDPDALVDQIKKEFSGISSHFRGSKGRDCAKMYYKRPSQFTIVKRKHDSLKTGASVEFNLFFRQPGIKKSIATKEGIKRLLALQLLIQIIDDRFKEMAKTYNASFEASCIDTYTNEGLPPALLINITSINNSEKCALQQIVRILNQLKEFGATKHEWDKVKSEGFMSMENPSPSDSQYWLKEIGKHFVKGEILFPYKWDYLRQGLTELTLEEFNSMISSFISEEPEDIGIIAPTGHKAVHLKHSEVLLWFQDAYKLPIKPYEVPQTPKTLVDSLEYAKLSKKMVRDKGTTKFGARELVLENGVKVVLMPYKPSPGIYDNRIMISALNPKGAFDFPVKDYFSAINAPNIIRNTGVGSFDKFTVERFLSKSGVENIQPYIGYKESGISGISTMNGLKDMLELIYLYFTNPRINKQAFEDWKTNQYKQYQNPSYNLISTDFRNAIKDFTEDEYLPLVFGARQLKGTKAYKGVAQTDLNKAYSIYQQLFGNAQNFTFLISGDFDLDSVTPLVQKYLGNLPNQGLPILSDNSKRPIKAAMPSGPLFQRIPSPGYKMKSINYALTFIKPAGNNIDWKDHIKTEILSEMTHLLSEGLRYDKGFSVFNYGVYGEFNKDMHRLEIFFEVQCEPHELELIRQESKKIIDDIKSGKVSHGVFGQAIKRSLYLLGKNNLENHRNMQKRLYEYYRYQKPWIDPEEIENYIKSLELKDIIKFSREVFKEKYQYEFVMSSQN